MLNFFGSYYGIDLLIICGAFLIVVLFALTIHEWAHSYIAFTQGDVTSKYFGRLSLNPFKHIDPIGFLCLCLFGFGWAKPVPVNTVKFKEYRKGIFLTSIAGVTANIIFSFISMGLLVFCSKFIDFESTNYLVNFLYYILLFGTQINLGLAIFNLIPIPPLDGYNVIASFTKGTNKFVQFLQRFGFIILLALLLFNIIDIIFAVVYNFVLPAFSNFWHFIF